MFQRFLSVLVITMLLFSAGPSTTIRAQDQLPPDKPAPETLKLLEDYIQQRFSNQAGATDHGVLAPIFSPALSPALLDKAQPDECYNGIGQPYSGTVSLGCQDSPYTSTFSVQTKVNQSYVWGLTQVGDDLFFGTAPNPLCMVLGNMFLTGGLPVPSGMQTPSYVCEFGSSQYADMVGNDSLGDWRPPEAFVYDTTMPPGTGGTALPGPTTITTGTVTFSDTVGFRSAGTNGSIVFLAGPALHPPGISIFAYDAPTGAYISSTILTSYTNVRRWLNAGGELYVGVAKVATGGTLGTVLRYVGGPDPSDIFNFEEVGTGLGADAAELTLHENRIFVNTWPRAGAINSLWMSRDISTGPLTAADMAPPPTGTWHMVWNYLSYDPDPVTAATTGGGALASSDGWLYWGTMHVPFASYIFHMNLYPPNPAWDTETAAMYQLASVLGSHRAISIFRGRNFGVFGDPDPMKNQKIELVYGEQSLPAFKDGSWQILPNSMGGVAPLYGPSGFGNFYNNYTWSMGTYKDELYVGTMDWSYLLEDGLEPLLDALGLPPELAQYLPGANPGADLWRFHSQNSPAEPINTSGVGNYLNYGIRTMIADADNFYLGTANPMNLMTSQTDDLPEGGWELVQMVSAPDLAIEKFATPEEVPLGEVFTYTLRVTNYGFAEATNVRVLDTLPPEVTYVGSNGTCIVSLMDPTQYTCSLGNLAGNDGYLPTSKEIEIYVTAPTTVGYVFNQANTWCDQFDPIYGNNFTSLYTLIDHPVELGISKTASREWVGPGQSLYYTIDVTNTGPDTFSPILPLVLTNTQYIDLPGYGMASPYPSTQVDLQGLMGEVQDVSVNLNGLNHTRTADLDVMLVSPEGTKVLLMSHAGGGLNFSSMNLAFEDGYPALPETTSIVSGRYSPTDYSTLPPIFPLAPLGPLEHQLSAFRGEDPNGTWRLYVYDHNLGSGGFIDRGWTLNLSLKRGIVVDVLPEYMDYTGFGSPDPWLCYEQNPNVLTCHLGQDLPAGSASQLTLITEVTETPPPGLPITLTNVATLIAGTVDLDPDNNVAQADVIFYPSPDLGIEKSTSYDATTIPLGTSFTYTLDVFNSDATGVGPASGIVVEDELPPEVSVVAVDPRCDIPTGLNITCDSLGELRPGETLDPPLVITVTAPNTVTWITNRATVFSEQNDADEDNFAYLWTLVDDPTDVEIVKSTSQINTVFGQSIVYTLNVINHGPGEFVSEVPFHFTNPDRIAIPFVGLADPYPSATAPISGLSGKIAHVSVTLDDISHAKSNDVDVLLVGPNGQGVILMSGAGTGVFGENLTFDDNASMNLPSDAVITTGIYKPTDYNAAHLFPPPAPLAPYADNLAVFNGLDPNGTWKLFVLDNGLLVGGEIDDGWTLNLTLERQVTVHDKLPEVIHLSTIQPGIWDCEAALGDVLCTSDMLPSSSQINLDVTVEFTTGLEILNTATVQTESYDPDLTNNTSEVAIYQWKWWLPFIMK